MNKDDLLQLAREFGIELTGNGTRWLEAHCPFTGNHKGRDRRPSFSVQVNENGLSGYICHSCQEKGGSMESLVHELLVHRKEDPKVIASEKVRVRDIEIGWRPQLSRSLLPWQRRNVGSTIAPIRPFLTSKEAIREPVPISEELVEIWLDSYEPIGGYPEAVAYMERRGISPETVSKLGLLYDLDERRIVFPVWGNKAFCGMSGRSIDPNGEPKIMDYPGLPKRHLILGSDRWTDRSVLLVEGLFGYAHLHEIGADQLFDLGAALGSALSEEKANLLKRHDKPVFLLFDNDEAGKTGMFGTMKANGTRTGNGARALLQKNGLLAHACIQWPKGKSDPDQLTLQEVTAMTQSAVRREKTTSDEQERSRYETRGDRALTKTL